MATASGRDVILTLMADVAELKHSAAATTDHLEEVAEHVEQLAEHVEQMAGHMVELVKLSRDSTKRFERMGRTLSKLADLLGDHEERISALEARE